MSNSFVYYVTIRVQALKNKLVLSVFETDMILSLKKILKLVRSTASKPVSPLRTRQERECNCIPFALNVCSSPRLESAPPHYAEKAAFTSRSALSGEKQSPCGSAGSEASGRALGCEETGGRRPFSSAHGPCGSHLQGPPISLSASPMISGCSCGMRWVLPPAAPTV